jgi:hypothetical protein
VCANAHHPFLKRIGAGFLPPYPVKEPGRFFLQPSAENFFIDEKSIRPQADAQC